MFAYKGRKLLDWIQLIYSLILMMINQGALGDYR